MKIKLRIIFYMGTTLMVGCSSLNSQFDCPMKPGVRCENIDSVNARVDRGELGQANIAYPPIEYKSNFHYSRNHYLSKEHPLRYAETVMRVWIAPFEDTAGNYHQESEIDTITKSGHWAGHPLKGTVGDEG